MYHFCTAYENTIKNEESWQKKNKKTRLVVLLKTVLLSIALCSFIKSTDAVSELKL